MTDTSLQVIDQRMVTFYGDTLVAARAADGRIYVALNQMCDALGISRYSQRRRIGDHAVLNEGYVTGDIETPPAPDGRGGGTQSAGLLRVDLVPLWLAGIQVARVSDDIKDKLIRFQKEAATVLWEAFQDGRLTAANDFNELLKADSPAAQAYLMARAVMQMAHNQLLIEGRMDTLEQRMEGLEAVVMDDSRHISTDQASRISQAVKLIALELSKRSGRNEYGGVYGELYRKFGITSYKELPADKYEAAAAFLKEWHQSLTDDSPF